MRRDFLRRFRFMTDPADPGAGGPPATPPVGDPPATPPAADPLTPAAPDPLLPPRTDAPPEPKAYDWTTDPHKLKEIKLGDLRLAGKYETVEALEAAYANASTLIGAKKDALAKELGFVVPEAYDFGDVAKSWDEKTSAAVQGEFKALGLTQEQAAKALPKLVEMAEALNTVQSKQALMEEWNLTGAAFEAHIGKVANWGQDRLPPDVYDKFRAMGVPGVLAVEAMMKSGTEMPMWKGESAPSSDDLDAQIRDVEAKLFRPEKPLSSQEKQALLDKKSKLYQLKYPESKAA